MKRREGVIFTTTERTYWHLFSELLPLGWRCFVAVLREAHTAGVTVSD